MKILILGGTGAMGADLVNILAEREDFVIVTSRSTRKTEHKNVKYVQGNAHSVIFLKELLNEKYDAIVDFMVYSTEEFKLRYNLLLDSTAQYIFLSSSRVYADSEKPIKETSPRLLDVTTDKDYLKTDEYALTKARQENMLYVSGRTNWTVIRPYITYSDQRLQLGVYEKELWLYRAMHGMTVVFPKDIAEKYTTMTLGKDVAMGISQLIGNEKAMGRAFHITSCEVIQWDQVLGIYKKVLKKVTGREMEIQYVDNSEPIHFMVNRYQVLYDRLFNRKFDNRNLIDAVGKYEFTLPEKGLERCLREFLKNPEFKNVSYTTLAKMDKLTKEKINLSWIQDPKQKMKYLAVRYLPGKVIGYLKAVMRSMTGEDNNVER